MHLNFIHIQTIHSLIQKTGISQVKINKKTKTKTTQDNGLFFVLLYLQI